MLSGAANCRAVSALGPLTARCIGAWADDLERGEVYSGGVHQQKAIYQGFVVVIGR